MKYETRNGCEQGDEPYFLNYVPPTWDETFMSDVYKSAEKSKDPCTKIGAVLVYWDKKDGFAKGYNGIARKVKDLPKRMERPEKYYWMSHAERNVIFHCARTGRATDGATLFTQGVPCCDCADAIINSGIVEVVVHKQWQYYEEKFNWKKWKDSAKRSHKKFEEANVKIRVFDCVLNMDAFLDERLIHI